MIIAIPLEDGKLCPHFGHCAKFALIQTDGKNAITARRDIDAPPHEPGLLPTWLHESGVNLIICGGMGPRALELFAQKGIDVITGAPLKHQRLLSQRILPEPCKRLQTVAIINCLNVHKKPRELVKVSAVGPERFYDVFFATFNSARFLRILLGAAASISQCVRSPRYSFPRIRPDD